MKEKNRKDYRLMDIVIENIVVSVLDISRSRNIEISHEGREAITKLRGINRCLAGGIIKAIVRHFD